MMLGSSLGGPSLDADVELLRFVSPRLSPARLCSSAAALGHQVGRQ